MKLIDLKDMEYSISGLKGFTFSEALRFWRTKFETVKHFHRDVITHPNLKELGSFMEGNWENIIPITVQEAFQEQNMERRRVMFDCIGVARLFQKLEPELLDRQTIGKKRTRWNEHNEPYEHDFQDSYELYRISGQKLFVFETFQRKPDAVYAVRCWCTTTGREYWIYVPEEIATGKTRWSSAEEKPDAIRAIAWTIRLDLSHPKRIYRQGDIIIAEETEDSKTVAPYHLTKEQYLELMFSES